MDKESSILQLKLKIIDLKLEKDKEIHSLLLSTLVGVLTFFAATGVILKVSNDFITNITRWAIKLQWYYSLLIILFLMLVLPLLAGFIFSKILNVIFRYKQKIYDDRIEDMNTLLTELNSKSKK